MSNVVLTELDEELERRGLEFCRFADDCNIFVGTEKSAQRVLATVSKFIETRLKLVVNWDKSKVALSSGVKFLGMSIVAGMLVISKQSVAKAFEKVKELTPRGTSQTLESSIRRINQWYIGWANYYKMTDYPKQLESVEAHIRRRLRSRIVDQHKQRRPLYNKVVKMGVSPRVAGIIFTHRGRWALSWSKPINQAFNNNWFKKQGFKTMSDSNQPHWHTGRIKTKRKVA